MVVTDAPANYKTSPSYIAYITEGSVKKAILLCQAKGTHGEVKLSNRFKALL